MHFHSQSRYYNTISLSLIITIVSFPVNIEIVKLNSLQIIEISAESGTAFRMKTHIQYDQTTNVYGALIGNSIKLDQGACFHYDRHLGNLQFGTTGDMLFSSWGETY